MKIIKWFGAEAHPRGESGYLDGHRRGELQVDRDPIPVIWMAPGFSNTYRPSSSSSFMIFRCLGKALAGIH